MKNLYKFLLFFILGIVISNKAISQPPPPNCPPAFSAGFDIIGDSVSYCLDGVNLQLLPVSTLYATDSYSVDPIPYNPYPWVGANSIIVGTDDFWSGVVPLPFPFCFFGQKYNAVVIGPNGQVGFDISQATLYNNWASAGWVAPNNVPEMNNCIMAPYHDIDPSVFYAGAKITWDIYGTAPCRYMVISWDSVPMFSCNNLLASQQVVLFESTYLIDINIKNKPLCAGWNSGTAHQGIQNANGTVAFMVPGRNGTQFTAVNDSYRFTPVGVQNLNYSVNWVDAVTGLSLGAGNTLTYFPPGPTKITADMQVITDCDTLIALMKDTIDILVTGSVTADFDMDIHLGCDDDTVFFTNLSIVAPGANPVYQWFFGDANGSNFTNPMHIYLTQDTFTVMLIANDNNCIDTITKFIDLRHPIKAVYGLNPGDSLCITQSISAISNSDPVGNVFHNWNYGDGVTINTGLNPLLPPPHYYPTAGTYKFTLVVTDTLGCQDSLSDIIYVDAPTYVDFTASDSNICVGTPIFFHDTINPANAKFTWYFGDGQILKNVHNPSHSWDQAGTYIVKLETDKIICPEAKKELTVVVNAYPQLSLGKDTAICPGLTGAILLADLNNPTAIHQWSTGETSNSIVVTQPGHYWVKASNGECSTTDSIWIQRDCYINIPNSFSPNGDGLNDYFLPRELLSSGVSSFKMEIYNRWGENIFTASSVDGRGWDGKYNGVAQPFGVYVYIIDVEFVNQVKKNFKGNVTLMR
ncbi:MAG: gliding motility-associated C-terminal domain-containing protein [Bacteroidetes bacterium]|nr:gliding motility-associated C-terminal domain-containing protein [Bacteroidota bacterium]MBK9300205.1 gliding motility-associated C-terminal domain-containing protein [Bacteroidota bacterium]